MSNERSEFTLLKVPTKEMIDILISLYEQGVDFIDITAVPNEGQDVIKISYTDAYMTSEEPENQDDAIAPPKITLSEDDLNDLI